MFQTTEVLSRHAPLIKRHGAYLPHWRIDGATYAVTFRLADSVPADLLRKWRIEREHIIARAEQMDRPLTSCELDRLDELHAEKIQTWLDQGFGSCTLREPAFAELVRSALTHFDGVRYTLFAWCVMPNHIHTVVQPTEGHDLSMILQSWKSYTGRKALAMLGKSGEGEFWQRESYDRVIRDHLELRRQIRYVLDNPRKANLPNWTWVGCTDWALELLGRDARDPSGALQDNAARIGLEPDATIGRP